MRNQEKHEFQTDRKIQLQNAYPEYSKKAINQMIMEEWKQGKGAGSSITNRSSTLHNEVIKTLIQRIPEFDISDFPDIYEITICEYCSYCSKRLNKKKTKTTGDHFLPVVGNSKTPILSNFSYLTIPCCSECNSSKQNKNWRVFIEAKPECSENIEKLCRLDTFIYNHIVYYEVDQADYDQVKADIKKKLEELRQSTQKIKLKEIPKEQLET